MISEAAKLLKVPRIYNAIITSDKDLLPSQAFPALSPILHNIHFPHFGNALYHPIPLNQNSDLYGTNDAKTIDKSGSQSDYDTYAKDAKGFPLNKNSFPDYPPKPNVALFMPNLKPKNEDNEDMPNIIPNSNFRMNRPDAMKQFYPHYDNEIGQIFDVMNYENKKVYSASSAVSTDSNSPSNPNPNSNNRIPSNPFFFPLQNGVTQPTTAQPNVYANNFLPNVARANENKSQFNKNIPSYVNISPEPEINQFPINYNFIKNNAPKDDGIVDVPPPPLPVGKVVPQRREANLPVNPNPPQWNLGS